MTEYINLFLRKNQYIWDGVPQVIFKSVIEKYEGDSHIYHARNTAQDPRPIEKKIT